MANEVDDSALDGFSANTIPSLRQRAEERALEKESLPACDSRLVSQEEMRQKIHELLVHQIELEMQNDELQHARLELEEAQARYLDLYDLAPVGYCTLDEDGLIKEANLAAAGMFGVTRGALVNRQITHFIHRDEQDAFYLYKRQLFETGEPQSFELKMTNGGAASFWAHLSANIMRDTDGELKCRVTISDITERKRAEEALRESEAQARVLAEALEKKNRLVTDFFINISHELKTPITLIKLALEIVEGYLKKPRLNRPGMLGRTAIIKQNANRLSRLVGNILDITKIDAGFMEPRFARVDIVGLITGLVGSMESFAHKKALKVEFMSSVKAKHMMTDSQIVERVILNLVSNAIKHTQEGGCIQISCTDMKSSIVVTVKDNGEGIPDEKKPIIFDRFRQVNTSLTRSSEGTGIGLSLIKALVNLLSGRIWFESTQGVGSEFFVELPVLQITEQSQQIEQYGITIGKQIEMEFSDIDFS